MPFLSQAPTKAVYSLKVFPKQHDQIHTAYQQREGFEQKAPGSINQKVVKGYGQKQTLILRLGKSRWQVWIETEIDFESKEITLAGMDRSRD